MKTFSITLAFGMLAWLAPLVIAQEELPVPPAENNQPLSIAYAVSLAEMNHPALRQASEAVEEARGTAVQAGLYKNPRLDSGNPQTIGGAQSIYSVGVTQEIIRGGKRRLDMAAAWQNVERNEHQFNLIRFAVITDSRRLFIAALATQRRVENLSSLLTFAKQLEQTNEKLYKAGQTSETDLLSLRLERRRAETAFQAAEAELIGRRKQLATHLGLPELPAVPLDGSLTLKFPAYDALSLDEQMIANNSLVNAAMVDVSRSQTLLQRAMAEPIPNITIQGGYQYTANAPNRQGLVGLYMDIPLWDRNQGGIRAAQANVGQSAAKLDVIRTELTKQLADALARYRASAGQVESFETGILPDARRTLELVRAGYEKGQFDIVRLLQAQRAVYEANLEYVSALEKRLDAAAEIAGLQQSESFP